MITFSQLGRYGRFANQLFQIAGTIGLATKHGYGYAFPKWINHDHKDRFGSSEDVDLQKYFVNPLPTTDISLPDFPISWGYHPDMHVPDGVSISGHMQSEKYFKHCIGNIRRYFQMHKDLAGPQQYVGLHIRRGDYDDRYHPILGYEYYDNAMAQYDERHQFAVVSDDLQAARKLLSPSKRHIEYYNHGQSYLDDFSFLKRCAGGVVCANSSFSLMAAILSEAPDKKIVCPSNWFGEAWGSGYKEMTKDLYPENAIVI